MTATMPETIRNVEELSLNAWPALQTVCYDGWLLRFAAGYTKRANSINPLYPATFAAADNIAYCEALYAERHHLDVVFKLTQATQPSVLDTALDRRGYQRIDETSVQILELTSRQFQEDAVPEGVMVNLSTTLTADWLTAYVGLSGVANHHLPTMEKMLRSIVAGQSCFIALTRRDNAETIAVGLAVLERGYVGLFDIVVAAPLREQGFGAHLIRHLLRWGKVHGAQTAYLQVVRENVPALRLYAKLGFAELYFYWYRVRKRA